MPLPRLPFVRTRAGLLAALWLTPPRRFPNRVAACRRVVPRRFLSDCITTRRHQGSWAYMKREKYPGQSTRYRDHSWRGDGVPSKVKPRPRTNPVPPIHRGKPSKLAAKRAQK